jgi:carbonic anhydrase
MQRLLEGYSKFRSQVFPQHSKLFEQLTQGQNPQALFICCSDSRVMPEMMMQCGPGDLFPCRNAGNLVPPPTETGSGVAATIEYAVNVLKVQDVIVCGHSDCGAMKGLLESEKLQSLPTVRLWLEQAGPSAKWLTRTLKQLPALTFEERLRALTEANVIHQMHNLMMHPAVADALRTKAIGVHGWMYEIGSGSIHTFDSALGYFRPLEADGEGEAGSKDKTQRKIA